MTADIAGETIVINETGKGPFQVEVRAASSTFLMDEPVAAGGSGSGPNPYDLLSAALGACSLMTIRLYARRSRWPLDKVSVRVTHHRDGLESKDRFVREIQLAGALDESQRNKLLEISMRCPVHKTIEHGSLIETKVIPADTTEMAPTTRCEHARDAGEACEDAATQEGIGEP